MASQADSTLPPLYCLNVQLDVKTERREEFLKCIRANQYGTLTTEPLAVTYIFGEDETTPNTFHFFEQYLGKEGFVAHTESPHFAAWEEFASSEPFTAPPKVSFYKEDSAGTPGLGKVEPGESTFGLIVRLCIKPDRRESFLAAMRADQDGALTAEPFCVSYIFGEDENEPDIFHMFELYKMAATDSWLTPSRHLTRLGQNSKQQIHFKSPRKSSTSTSRVLSKNSFSRQMGLIFTSTRRFGAASRKRQRQVLAYFLLHFWVLLVVIRLFGS